MVSEELIGDSGDSVLAVKEKRMTGRAFLFQQLDGALTDEDLNKRGNAFACHYYKKYMGDYDRFAAGNCLRHTTSATRGATATRWQK
jgi:hypothetical protein